MDPLSCRCASTGSLGVSGDSGGGSVSGKRKADGSAVQREREVYDPPVLWPVNGEKFAYRRERGPVEHGLRLESAYAQQGDAWGTGEPAFSTYHHMFKVMALTFSGCWGVLVAVCT